VYLRLRPEDLAADPTILRFPGWAIPDSTSDGQPLWDAAAEIIADGTPAAGLLQEFRLLERDADYSLIFDGSTVVGLELAAPAPATELRTLAVRYLNPSGVPIGGTYTYYGISASDTLVLEMIRPPDPRPTEPFGSTWALAMRNAYALGWQDIAPASLTVVINDVISVRADNSRPDGSSVPYMQIFGLDVTDDTGTGPPDGRIDPERIDLARGIIWFPDRRAFAPNPDRVFDWTDDSFQFSGPYQAQYDRARRIYEERLNAAQANDVFQYLITATVTVPAP
jgi:cell surface protein SprA